MKSKFLKTISGKLSSVKFKTQKHSPEIFLAIGIGGTIVSAVLACGATMKAPKILEEAKDNVDTIHKALDAAESNESLNYSVDDSKKDLTLVYIQTGVKFAKLYAPAIVLETLSIISICSSHRIMRQRSAALAAAYAAVDQSYKNYRKRVAERFGEAVEREIRYDIKAKQIEVDEVDEKTGEVKQVKKDIAVSNADSGDYIYYFDRTCNGWDPNIDYCMFNLRATEKYANDLFFARGHLFLNEVLDMLDIPRSMKGQAVGWRYVPDDPNRDNEVKFRIQVVNRPNEAGIIEQAIMLDFNVDGTIFYDFDKNN